MRVMRRWESSKERGLQHEEHRAKSRVSAEDRRCSGSDADAAHEDYRAAMIAGVLGP